MHQIREANPSEYIKLGTLMVDVYSQLEGFPNQDEIPEYYHHLRNVGEFAKSPKVKLFVAVSNKGNVDGGLVYFGDLRYYGGGNESTHKQNAAAFRLLTVNPNFRGLGLGKKLIETCFKQAKKEGFKDFVIHSTKYMMVAWKMYERIGFVRFPEIDFDERGVKVFGFRYKL